MAVREFRPGFRLSFVDIAVLVLGCIGVVAFALLKWQIALVIGFVVPHFFLFCNVFRVARPLELIWSFVFLLLVGATVIWHTPGWLASIATSLVITIVVVVLEMVKPSYHGVGWQKINPGLPEWWQTHGGQPATDSFGKSN